MTGRFYLMQDPQWAITDLALPVGFTKTLLGPRLLSLVTLIAPQFPPMGFIAFLVGGV